MQYAPCMAYEFDIEVDPDPPFTDNLGLEIVEFALGYDVDADLVVVMSVMLVPVHDPEAHDLRFGIRENSLSKDWRVGGLDYTKESVDKYIPKEWRAFVLTQVGRAVRTLVDKVKPDNVTMETYYAGLEQKALQKYALIGAAVCGCGYLVGDQFRDEGSQKDYWLFTKRV
jgi:hypothetical protein